MDAMTGMDVLALVALLGVYALALVGLAWMGCQRDGVR